MYTICSVHHTAPARCWRRIRYRRSLTRHALTQKYTPCCTSNTRHCPNPVDEAIWKQKKKKKRHEESILNKPCVRPIISVCPHHFYVCMFYFLLVQLGGEGGGNRGPSYVGRILQNAWIVRGKYLLCTQKLHVFFCRRFCNLDKNRVTKN